MSDASGYIIECNKCKIPYDSNAWESGLTYHGIDRHHNPPEIICKALGIKWIGEMYNLCRKCHNKLHVKIKKILNKNSNSSKFINSEHWIMKKMTISQIQKSKDEIYEFTKKWVEEDDTKTTL